MTNQKPAELNIPTILRLAEIKPSKGLGQNFLSDSIILERIVAAAHIQSTDSVLEIGPGLGSLTMHLACRAKEVVAVELDRKMIPLLEMHLQPYSNVRIIQGDMLEVDPCNLHLEPGYLVVANIPYYITSAIIRHLLESSCQPARMVLTVQEEVAQRICAEAGDLNLLALSIQVFGKPSRLFKIPAGAFYPPPRVDSAVLGIELHPEPLIPSQKLDQFFDLIKAGFGQKRKTLRNSLSHGLHLPLASIEDHLRAAGIDPQRRAETVSIPEWRTILTFFED